MRFVDEYRDPDLANALIQQIRSVATRRWTVMEVCGGQTHSLLRHGIDEALSDCVELIHGPGCPVCVTPAEAIDFAIGLSLEPGVLVASFGDMLRVPGSNRSLLSARADGGSVRIVYSPLDAVEIARQNVDRQVVFFAVGFETTAPSTALAVLQADRLGLENFSVLTAHVRVLPAMHAILRDPHCRVQGFLAAGHVCTVMGFRQYEELATAFRVPIVVTGFEPVDLLAGLLETVRQLEAGECRVVNGYHRAVEDEGNAQARGIVDRVYSVADAAWRGLGVIPGGGLVLRPQWSRFDAFQRFPLNRVMMSAPQPECRSGDVLTGRIRPSECPEFGVRCRPESPLGAPMVSSEGACAAYYRYRHTEPRAQS
ncbi:MAG: hydrogenase formation protein HypD [Planctomycetaceae bacterium]|nr:hydrogenase formation protein HypD [Planctomycetaceae bacterium]